MGLANTGRIRNDGADPKGKRRDHPRAPSVAAGCAELMCQPAINCWTKEADPVQTACQHSASERKREMAAIPSAWSICRRSAILLALGCVAPLGVLAQNFPSRTITIVVPYPPGSGTDSLARILQPKLSEAFKQTVIVENRPGASTNIGTEYVAHAAPDGHTILFQAPNIATNEFAYSNLRWKREDFAPVTLLVKYSNVLLAGPSATARDFRQLVAAARKQTATTTMARPVLGRCPTWPWRC